MAAPKSEHVVRQLHEIGRLVTAKGQPTELVGLVVEIEQNYRWADGYAHAPSQTDHERVSGGAGPTTGGTTANVGLSGEVRTRSGATRRASTQDFVRTKQESAAARVRDALALLRGASADLTRALAAIDTDRTHTPSAFFDGVPRQESADELGRLRGAQARRIEREEVYAEDALPVPETEYSTHRFVGRGLLCRDCGETSKHPVHST